MFSPQKRQHSIAYSQNFLVNPSLARYVVSLAKLQPEDTVVEVGPGKGILTKALLQHTQNLILVEKDKELAQALRTTYTDTPSIKVIATDIRDYRIGGKPYKIFANPPFNILSQFVKKFVFAANAPEAMYLFMQKEAMRRFAGKPTENQVSILIKTWYRIKELHEFARTDFSPVPSIDVSLAAFTARPDAVVSREDKPHYILFVQYGYQQQKASLKKNFEKIFTHEQWKRLAQNLKFSVEAQPTELTADQWAQLFTYYKSNVTPEKQRIIQLFTPRV